MQPDLPTFSVVRDQRHGLRLTVVPGSVAVQRVFEVAGVDQEPPDVDFQGHVAWR